MDVMCEQLQGLLLSLHQQEALENSAEYDGELDPNTKTPKQESESIEVINYP